MHRSIKGLVATAQQELDTTRAVLELHRRAAARHQQELDRTESRLARFRSEQHLLPHLFSTRRIGTADEHRSVREQVFLEEAAHVAAYEVVADVHRLALGAAHRTVYPVPEQGTEIAPAHPVAHAVHYTAAYTRSHDSGRTRHPEILSADLVEFALSRWRREGSARILIDSSCTYTVALPGRYIELRPVEEPAPTEGDVLNAALGVYGVPSYPMAESGITYRVIPLDTAATGQDVHTGARLFARSGESADRGVEAHGEPWTITLHDTDGDEIRPLYSGSPAPGGIAEESVDCAKFAASWIRDHAHAWL
ncbi:hypothetical protein [Streptomyces sp. 4F14]|uniref:hypothetical protein n=1 Tax=Streptomyces sp. 4F14 TaxID=3394380 RepID=UPI003A89BB4C